MPLKPYVRDVVPPPVVVLIGRFQAVVALSDRDAEVQPALGDVLARVVVQAGRDDALVRHALDVLGSSTVFGLVGSQEDVCELHDDLQRPTSEGIGSRGGGLERG